MRSALGLLACLGCWLAPASAGTDAALRQAALRLGQPAPIVRIGLESGHRLTVSAASGLRVVDAASGGDVWKPSYRGEVVIVAQGGPTGDVPVVFRIQAGAFSDRQAAADRREELEQRFGSPVVLRHDPDRGNWRVRVGKAQDREALQPLMSRMREAGFDDLWIAEEPAGEAAGIRLRVVDESYESREVASARLAVLPLGRDRVEVEGRPYRGVVELRVSRFGTVQAINWVGLEPYLLGVVPAELGPEVWPELAALRAQAVAARTYVWRNLGQFDEDGYDLCATPRCQVYGGAAAEHPLSDRAVWSTRGQVLTYERQPINAYFTATCGGHTEDVSNVFVGESAPYLVGVPCRAEAEALRTLRGVARGARLTAVVDESGTDRTRAWALLAAAGVLDAERDGPGAMAGPLEPGTLRRWTDALNRLAGRPATSGPPGAVSTLGKAALSALEDLGWAERAAVLMGEADPDALVRDVSVSELSEPERRAVAYLAGIEMLAPHLDGSFHAGEPPGRARLLGVLAGAGESYEAFRLRTGDVVRLRGEVLKVSQGKGELSASLAARPYLFGYAGGRSAPRSELELWPGDRVRFRLDAAGRIDFLELLPPVRGLADDRSSSRFSWQERKSRNELEREINRRVKIGTLLDLRVMRRGVSGRVAELEVVGSEGRTLIRGFDVRRLLGLQESLMVLEPQRTSEGRLEAVVFTGKGWGHGVGLCQVGAYGMALRGADYRAILAHYYPGTEVREPPLGSGRAGR